MCWRFADWIEPRDLHLPDTTKLLARFEKLRPILAKAKRLNLTGPGEPLLDPALLPILDICAEYPDLHTSFNTNGQQLTPAIAKRLVGTKLSHINFHIDSPEPDGYAAIMRGGQLDRVIAHIEELRAIREQAGTSRPSIGLVMVILRQNITAMPAMIDLAARLKLDLVQFQFAQIYQAGLRQESVVSYRGQVKKYLRRARQRAKTLNISVYDGLSGPMKLNWWINLKNFRQPTQCNAPWHTCAILPDGRLLPCCMTGPDLGNLDDSPDFETLWNGPVAQKIRADFIAGCLPAKCQACYLMGRDNFFILERL
jgi:radical SAM protein with 4Fe4S-binding SPASM domain